MISKILVTTDGSKAAQEAVRYAVYLAKQLKASVIIMSIIDSRLFILQKKPVSGAMRDVVEPSYPHAVAEMYTKEAEQLCEDNAVESKVLIKIGHPVEEIIKEAEKLKANLIIIGSRGHSALAASVLGSVTYGVIYANTKIPIMVVKE